MTRKQKSISSDTGAPDSTEDQEIFSQDELAALESVKPEGTVSASSRVIKVEAEEEEETPKSSRKKILEATQQFSDLYRRGATGTPSVHFDRTVPGRRKKIIIAIVCGLLVICGAVAAGFYFFVNREPQFSNESIAIRFEDDPVITSGAASTLIIVVENNESVAVQDVELTLQLPDSFAYQSSIPQAENDAHNAWQLGTIEPGKQKRLSLTGMFLGETGSTLSFPAILSYTPSNFSSVFQTQATLHTAISGSVLELDLESPPKSIAGRDDTYTLTLTNTADHPISQVEISVTVPDMMAVSNIKPAPRAADDLTWTIGEFKAGDHMSITWSGSMDAGQGTSGEITARAGYTDSTGGYVPQADVSALVFVINPQLLVTIQQNGSIHGEPRAFGEIVSYTVMLENGSDTTIENIIVDLKLAGVVINWDGLVDSDAGSLKDGTLTWDAIAVPALASLAPNDTTEISIQVPVSSTFVASSPNDGNYTITATATAHSSAVRDLEGEILSVTSVPVETKIISAVTLRSEGRYYNDEYILVGTGPHPPEIGVATTYRMYWYLQNTTNEVQQVTVSAELPQGVVWAFQSTTTAGDISYNAETRIVTWTINRLPKHIGKFFPELEASFGVTVTPSASDVGTPLVLLNAASAEGRDAFTESDIVKITAPITSALPTDPVVAGDGVVVMPAPSSEVNSNTNSNLNTNEL